MPFRINPIVDEQNHHRSHFGESHYIRTLADRGLLIELDNIMVDAEQLVLRCFECDTNWCVRCKGKGSAKTFKGSCCTDLEVDLTHDEAEKLVQLGEAAQALNYAPSHPVGRVADRMRRNAFTHITDEKKELALRHLGSTRCSLSWMEKNGTLRCAINSLCDALDLPLDQYKPDPCFHFPLHYVEHEPGKFFLTVICQETYQWIGADSYVANLRCLSKPKPGAPPAFIALKYEIIQCFGKRLYKALESAATPLLDGANGSRGDRHREEVTG